MVHLIVSGMLNVMNMKDTNNLGIYIHVLLLLLLSRFSRVRLCATPWMAAHQAPHPWDSPGKNNGVGCHFLLQYIHIDSTKLIFTR